MKSDAALERYFQEAASWDRDRAAMNERSVRIAWRIAIGACALTVMAVAPLLAAALLPCPCAVWSSGFVALNPLYS